MQVDSTLIRAKKDLFNKGRCFTKGNEYIVFGTTKTEAGLMERQTINDMNEPHLIGSWWRNFVIVKP